jgi:uncharacterized protein (TIGR02996 family)
MIDQERFLQAILENPCENTPRRVFADYLEETGEPEMVLRAQFIRFQIELDEIPIKDRDQECFRQARYWGAKVAEQTGWRHIGGFRYSQNDRIFYTFRNGFIEVIELPEKTWLETGRVIVQKMPLERVSLSDRKPHPLADNLWAWDESLSDIYRIPEWRINFKIFRYLDQASIRGNTAFYKRPGIARADLSNACLKWAGSPSISCRPPASASHASQDSE